MVTITYEKRLLPFSYGDNKTGKVVAS